MSDSIIYLRQSIKRLRPISNLLAGSQEERFTAHFYVRTVDVSDAGGAAATFCMEQGWECDEYICLAQPIARSQIEPHEDEHLAAFDLAYEKGFSVVAVSVLIWGSPE